jgi:hypothetical protein
MTVVRRHLGFVICLWLASQATALSVAPVALWRAAHGEQECDCPIEAGATCPMHHSSRDDDGTCKLRRAFGSSDRALVALMGGLGLLPPSTLTVNIFEPRSAVVTFFSPVISRASIPDSPPPRA